MVSKGDSPQGQQRLHEHPTSEAEKVSLGFAKRLLSCDSSDTHGSASLGSDGAGFLSSCRHVDEEAIQGVTGKAWRLPQLRRQSLRTPSMPEPKPSKIV